MYVCVCVCMYVCIYVCMYICMYVYICVCVFNFQFCGFYLSLKNFVPLILYYLLFCLKETKLHKHAKTLFLSEKPAPNLQSQFSVRDRFYVGSLSHALDQQCHGFVELPLFPEVAPDSSVRDVVEDKPLALDTKQSFYEEEEESNESSEDESDESGSGSSSGGSDDESEESEEESGSESDSEASGQRSPMTESESDESGEDDESESSSSDSEEFGALIVYVFIFIRLHFPQK